MGKKSPPPSSELPSYLEVTGASAGRSPSPVPPPFNPNPIPQTYASAPMMPATVTAPVPMITTAPIVVTNNVLPVIPVGPSSLHLVCPHCRASVTTTVTKKPGMLAYAFAGLLCVMGCAFGCCLLPFLVPQWKDVDHTCPSCRSFLGSYSSTGRHGRRRNGYYAPQYVQQYVPQQVPQYAPQQVPQYVPH